MAVAATSIMDPTVVLSTVEAVPVDYDITDQVSSCTVTEEATVLDKTTFGNTWRNKGRGLKSGSLALEFYVDFDVDGTFATFTALWGHASDLVTFVVTDPDTSAAVSGTIVMSQVPSFAGGVDEYNQASITWETTGAITRTDAV